jgi:hypothetical protein
MAAMGSPAGGGVDALDDPRKASPQLEKASPPLGGDCGCSVKNYPMQFILSPRAAQDPNPSRNGYSAPQPAEVEAHEY